MLKYGKTVLSSINSNPIYFSSMQRNEYVHDVLHRNTLSSPISYGLHISRHKVCDPKSWHLPHHEYIDRKNNNVIFIYT